MLNSINFNALQSLNGTITIGIQTQLQPILKTASFASLTYLGGDLNVESDASLISLIFNNLTVVNQNLFVDYNSVLSTLAFPSLTLIVNGLYVYENAILSYLSLPSLTSVLFEIYICNNAASLPVPRNIYTAGPMSASACGEKLGCCTIQNVTDAGVCPSHYVACGWKN